jgi:hypothetical protein
LFVHKNVFENEEGVLNLLVVFAGAELGAHRGIDTGRNGRVYLSPGTVWFAGNHCDADSLKK